MAEMILDAKLACLAHDTGRPVKIFDVETTGLGGDAQIIQFSGVTVNASTWEIIDSEDFFINVGIPLSPRIKDLTGITDELLQEQGITEAEAYERIKTWFGDCIISGYNVKFDIGKVNFLYSKFNDVFAPVDVIDVYQIVRKYCANEKVPNQKLTTMTNYFLNGEGFQFHRAIDDSIATARVLQKLYEVKLSQEPTTDVFGNVIETPKKQYFFTSRPTIESNGTLKTKVTKISRWTKSQKMDRLYISFIIPEISTAENMIFFDYTDGKFKEKDYSTDLISKVDMNNLETQVFDIILESNVWNYTDFGGTAFPCDDIV